MTTIRLDHLTKTFSGSTTPVVDDVSLDIADDEFVVLVGPSGSEKSLRLHKVSHDEVRSRVREAADLLELEASSTAVPVVGW
jgi:ABC-type nitrate/sulfonate/bicarbonate transport system ATPase subunit